MKSRFWIIGYLILVFGILTMVGISVFKIDPFFHFHSPDTDSYYYSLDNERSQNDGILRNFNYEGLIIGSSMAQNFKTSEAEDIFGCSFVKTSMAGASYKEVNDNIATALSNNNNIKIVIRPLDRTRFFVDKNAMRDDLGQFPTYLYDADPLNDVKYLFNRDVVFSRIYPMIKERYKDDFKNGITSFDDYSNSMSYFHFGIDTAFPDGIDYTNRITEQQDLSQRDRELLIGTVDQNIISLAEAYPEVTFFYYITPYSAIWWQRTLSSGNFEKQMQAERLFIERILEVENIKLYSFNNLTDIICDLNNYTDVYHYGSWINSLILKYLGEGEGLLTRENYENYLKDEEDFFYSFDYENELNKQEDYEQDFYAAALLNERINGVEPYVWDDSKLEESEHKNSKIVANSIICKGHLGREKDSNESVANYMIVNDDYVGAKLKIDEIGKHNYLVFKGRKSVNKGEPTVCVYDEKGKLIVQLQRSCNLLDREWHQYLIDLSGYEGAATVIFNGGCVDNSGSIGSEFIFRDIVLY